MSDTMSAASLFFAVIGLFYGSWFGDIQTELRREKAIHRPDRTSTIRDMEAAKRSKAVPLALVSTVFAVVLLPDLVQLFASATRSFWNDGLGAFCHYSSVKTLFSAMVIIGCVMSVHAWHLVVKLNNRIASFKVKDE
ncbi:MAG: hypothetical protein KAR44_12605 [Candidatus Aegiribacteria sp.]|nr:hypothetical protein [Candidatus Aegiribacteria sp.]